MKTIALKADKPRESDVQAACLSLLAAHGFIVVRPPRRKKGAMSVPLWQTLASEIKRHRPRGIVWRNNTGQIGHLGFGVPGMADILGILSGRDVPQECGRLFSLEVKVPGKRPTAEQLAWADCVGTMGGLAIWVSSGDELLEWFREMRWSR